MNDSVLNLSRKFLPVLISILLCSLNAVAAEDSITPAENNLTGLADSGFLQRLNISDQNILDQARRGEAFFNTAFIAAPASATLRDGLGPLHNASSCDNCHSQHGRRRVVKSSGALPLSTVVQFSQLIDGRWQPDEVYAENLNPLAVNGVPPEGWVSVDWLEERKTSDNGYSVTVRRPQLQFHDLAYGPLNNNTRYSVRLAPALFGVGLLAAISADDIVSWADPHDQNNDGISGRINEIKTSQGKEIGRFGWKANHSSLVDQISSALSNEQGITNSLRPVKNCTAKQTDCLNAADGGDPEISAADFNAVVLYNWLFPVPERRDAGNVIVVKGEALFHDLGCQQCHRAQFSTAKNSLSPVSEKNIYPYTDLLLHDMGEDLADGRPDYSASGSEWRTAPLWGIGLAESLGIETCYLHDCRARTLEEAIVWHGGEAKTVIRRWNLLPAEQKNALLMFLKSL